MILGASYSQLPLMEAAKRLGHTTVAASIPGEYPCFALADETAYVDISDPEAVTKAASRFAVDGIATCSLDLGMRAIGAACEALALPGPSAQAAKKASNKLYMKTALQAAGVQTARFLCLHNEEELEAALEELPFPVILKAVDQMGSRGIHRSDTKEEARVNFRKSMEATKKDYCLIEEFIEGELFGAEAMIQHGKLLYCLPNNTEAFQAEVPTPVGHSVPYRYPDLLPQIEEQVEKAIRALGLDDCPVNCDLIRRGDQVYIVELTGRSGATGLSEMVGAIYGLNYYEMILRLSVGEELSPYFAEKRGAKAFLSHTLSADRAGVVRRIHQENRLAEDVIDLSFNIVPGDAVRPYTNGRDRIGQVFLKGESLPACEKRLKEITAKIRLELEGDLPLPESSIQKLSGTYEGNEIYIKREDLLPFAFGGNKLRFSQYYLEDMERKGCDAMILYGGYHSNLCRVLSAACAAREIPCSMIYMTDDLEEEAAGCNKAMITACGVREYRCHKQEIADTVKKAMEDLLAEGRKPYYIHGDRFGRGGEIPPMEAYVAAYHEICRQEREMGLCFDAIYLASSTNATQSGLMAAHLMEGDLRKIVGISVNRGAARAREVILHNLEVYRREKQAEYRLDPVTELYFEDRYLCGGYGQADETVRNVIRTMYLKEGICLDPTYTGKAFTGMLRHLKESSTRDRKILFLHTGGTPLFADGAEEIFR